MPVARRLNTIRGGFNVRSKSVITSNTPEELVAS